MQRTRQIIFGAIACGITAAAFFITSCSNNNNNPVSGGGQKFAPPTALRALSGDDTLYLVWHHSADVDSTAFASYTFTAVNNSTGASLSPQQPINKGDTAIAISGLTNGTVYTITMYSVATDGTQGPASKSLEWAPAKRYYNDTLYSLAASSGCPSGLQLRASGVKPISVALDPDSVDLVFDDRGTTFDIVSPNLKSGKGLPDSTKFAGYIGVANGLSDLALADSTVDTQNWYAADAPLGSDGQGHGSAYGTSHDKGVAFYVLTEEGNYARVYIHPINGLLYATDTNPSDPCSGATFIVVDISFQTAAGIQYSLAHKAVNVKKSN